MLKIVSNYSLSLENQETMNMLMLFVSTVGHKMKTSQKSVFSDCALRF